jgi:protein involved in polysaccharide export with SLBB domain
MSCIKFCLVVIFLTLQVPNVIAQSLAPVTTEGITPPEKPAAPQTTSGLPDPGRFSSGKITGEDILRPFGAALFDSPIVTASAGPNPDYVVNVGDEILVRIWGSLTADIRTVVDQQGNIFVPQVGPITVSGVRAGEISAVVEKPIKEVYQNNVAVYVTLVQWQSIGVFVSGFVQYPGRYPGISTESVLEFLSRAGGIDERKGSFRDIRVIRASTIIDTIDLYEFLLNGVLPTTQFRDGDTIIVGPQRSTIAVSGTVRNGYWFETKSGNGMKGKSLIPLARPLPQSTYAKLIGTRSGQPLTRYIPVSQLDDVRFEDQDSVEFVADAQKKSITIEVSGSFQSPSVLITDPNVTLLQVLNYIEVDPDIADTSAVHIRRLSVAQQQKVSLETSLDRLERSLLNVSVATEGEAVIRQAEAELVSKYIARARNVIPDGTVVVLDSAGDMADLRMEDGDTIVIPRKRSVVIVSGEVLAPQAIVYEENQSAKNLIDRAGGFTERADEEQVIIRKTNGQILLGTLDSVVTPGDEIFVIPKIEFKTFQFTKDVVQIIYQIAVATGVLIGIL